MSDDLPSALALANAGLGIAQKWLNALIDDNAQLRTQNIEAAAFLDGLAARTVDFPGVVSDEGNEFLVRAAADCRAMAAKLRGET